MSRCRIAKDQILTVAEKHFASKKFHEVLMSDIAQDLNISKGSLYNYFPSKEDLYIQIISQGIPFKGYRRIMNPLIVRIIQIRNFNITTSTKSNNIKYIA